MGDDATEVYYPPEVADAWESGRRQGRMDAKQEIKQLRNALHDVAFRSVAPDDLPWCQRRAREALREINGHCEEAD